MIHTIKNEFLTVQVSELGAELSSIVCAGREYLWQGNPIFWAGRAPILFPVVGKLKGGALIYGQDKYIVPNHGIVRGSMFSLIEKTDDAITLSLSDNDETKMVYPHDFELRVTYTLSGHSLHTGLQVTNRSDVEIHFSIGGHPAFNCPLDPGESFEDYEIVLNEKETAGVRLLNQDGLVSDKTAPFFNDSSKIIMDYSYFYRYGTLVFKKLNSNVATLRSRKSGLAVSLDFTGFQYFAVWTKPGAPFVSIQPWQGICDSSFYSGNFRGKTGTIKLAPEEASSFGFTITPAPV